MNEVTIRTKRDEILNQLRTQFGLTESALERILFLNERDPVEPWLPADLLQAIARQIDGFKDSSVLHDKFIPETNQVVYTATVYDTQSRSYTRPGVAMVGEKPNGYDIPPEILAEGRALSSALSAAGFHPFKSASVVNLADARVAIQNRQQTQEFTGIEDKAELRKKDLRQIHALAEEKGLIVGRDDTEYRIWLTKKFGVKTAALLEDVDRTRVINALRNYKDEFEDLPSDMRDDAKVA